ncbi:MAG: DUF4418 family protein [Clostridiales Family XIII bacterium]|jgi:hypothetical protein|nr:DUF4418 family protein [Clostridiales Family XIII bacterium]
MTTTQQDAKAVLKTGGNYLGVPILAIGVVVAVVPRLVYQMFESAHGMPMRCYATANAEIAVGAALVVFGALYFFSRSAKLRLAASVLAILSAVLALLFPTALTGLCGDAHMACHVLTLPALFASCALIVLFSIIGVVLSARALRADKKGRAAGIVDAER